MSSTSLTAGAAAAAAATPLSSASKRSLLPPAALTKLLNAVHIDGSNRPLLDLVLTSAASSLPEATHSQILTSSCLLTRLLEEQQQQQEQDASSSASGGSAPAGSTTKNNKNATVVTDLLQALLDSTNTTTTYDTVVICSMTKAVELCQQVLQQHPTLCDDGGTTASVVQGSLDSIQKSCAHYHQLWRDAFIPSFAALQNVLAISSSQALEPSVPGVREPGPTQQQKTATTAPPANTTTSVLDPRALELAWKLAVCSTSESNPHAALVAVGCLAALITSYFDVSNKRAKITNTTATGTSSTSTAASSLDTICATLAALGRNTMSAEQLKQDIAKLTQKLHKALESLDDDALRTAYKPPDESSSTTTAEQDDKNNNSKKRSSSSDDTSAFASTDAKLVFYLPTVIDELYRSWWTDPSTPIQYLDPLKIVQVGSIVSTVGAGNTTAARTLSYVDYLVENNSSSSSTTQAPPAAVSQELLQAAAADLQHAGAPRAITPPVITDAMELNEWAVSVSFLELVQPCEKLEALLRTVSRNWDHVLIPLVNKTLLKLSQENLQEKATRKAPVVLCAQRNIGELAQVQVFGELTPDKQLYKAVVAFYFHALEAILYCEKVRLSKEREEASSKQKATASASGTEKSKNKSKNSNTDSSNAYTKLVTNPVFHNALLSCCCSCVTKAIGCTQKLHPSSYLRNLQIYSILHVTGTTPYQFLKVSETFVRALAPDSPAAGQLGSPLIFGLPRILQADIQQVEINILDSLVWARNSTSSSAGSLTDTILDFQEKTAKEQLYVGGVTLWPPETLAPTLRAEVLDHQVDDQGEEILEPRTLYPNSKHEDFAEFNCVSYVIRKLLKLAYHRINAICKQLRVPEESSVAAQVWITFRYLMRNGIELLFDRHVDHWILCSIYGVSRTVRYQPELKFAQIIDAYVAVRGHELGGVTCQRIVRHIKIVSTGKEATESMGNVITLYNKVFVPAMKEHLLNSKSLKKCTEQVARMQAAEGSAGHPTGGLRLSSSPQPLAPGFFAGGRTAASLQFGHADSSAVAQMNESASPGTPGVQMHEI